MSGMTENLHQHLYISRTGMILCTDYEDKHHFYHKNDWVNSLNLCFVPQRTIFSVLESTSEEAVNSYSRFLRRWTESIEICFDSYHICVLLVLSVYPEEFLPTYGSIKEHSAITKVEQVSVISVRV